MSQLRILMGAAAVIALLLFVPIVGLVALGIFLIAGIALWVTEDRQPPSRPCPVCGEPVANGLTECGGCGHDFRAAASG